jgi:hypothetical protein
VDAVVLLDVVEHVDDDRAFVGDLVAGLDPGAVLIATVPALPSLFSAWDEAMGHHRRYTRRSLRAVVAGLPVDVDECSYLFPELLPAAVARRVTKPRRAAISPEFPDLPRPLDDLLFRVGRLTARVRAYSPAGTSLLIVATRTR